MKTMICLLLDRSGSMSGREKDVIGGVNTFIEEQKQMKDPASERPSASGTWSPPA